MGRGFGYCFHNNAIFIGTHHKISNFAYQHWFVKESQNLCQDLNYEQKTNEKDLRIIQNGIMN